MVFDQIMGKDNDPTMSDTTVEDLDEGMDDELDDEITVADEEDEVDASGLPKGFSIEFDVVPPKRKSNLTGREGIKWAELLEPLTVEGAIGKWHRIYDYSYSDDEERRRRANLCASKSAAIRKNLEDTVPNEDWDVMVRTNEDTARVGIFAKYHGALTPERKEFKEKRKEAYRSRGQGNKAEVTEAEAE
jgi:hypothetical protein